MASLISVDGKIYFVGPQSMTGDRIRRMAYVPPEKGLYLEVETSDGVLFEEVGDERVVDMVEGVKLFTKEWPSE